MANKDFKDYAIAGSNVTLTYDDINDTVTFAAQGNVQSVNGKTGVVVINKTDVSLGNVDNTSDANKPISSATQTALDLKVDENALITGATKTKITYDAKGLVTSGADATTSDITDSTDKRYVTDAQLVVVGNTSGTNTGDNATNSQYSGLAASKQDTLVSGTNIKTINSTSLLGSGNIAISTPPSGVAGAIQFSDGSAFASDAANLFWDDTNNRLGIGKNNPVGTLDVLGNILMSGGSGTYSVDLLPTAGFRMQNSFASVRGINNFLKLSGTNGVQLLSSTIIGDESTPTARLQVKGTGATSATTSLLVQNSSATQLFKIADDGGINLGTALTVNGAGGGGIVGSTGGRMSIQSQFDMTIFANNGGVNVGATAAATDASAIFEARSTTKGLLFPRMTTTQKNAISSPASGLVIYDTTLGKLCVRGASAWETITSV